MPKAYSDDLRARVIEAIEAGASRHDAAERYEIGASTAVLWRRRWEETGRIDPRIASTVNATPGASRHPMFRNSIPAPGETRHGRGSGLNVAVLMIFEESIAEAYSS